MSNFKIGRGHLQLQQALGKQTLLGTGSLSIAGRWGAGPKEVLCPRDDPFTGFSPFHRGA